MERHRADLLIAAEPPAAAGAAGFILAPWLAALPPEGRELLALLPVIDANGTTLGAIAARRGGIPPTAAAALMLADPFLRVRDTARLLAEAGIGRIANFPTVQLVDGETARAFDSADVGAAREVAMLAAFRRAGFEATAFACGLGTARAMLGAGASSVVLHPGVALGDWRQRAAAAAAVFRTLTALRRETAATLLVHRPRGYGAELDQAAGAADGEVRVLEP